MFDITSGCNAAVLPKFTLNFAFSGILNFNLPVDLSIAFRSTSLISRIFKYFSPGLLP